MKSIAIITILLTICAACSKQDEAPLTESTKSNTTFSLKLKMEGIIALVQKPKATPNRMYVIFPKTSDTGNNPPNCRSGLERHFPAIRISTKYLSPDVTVGDVMSVFPLNGEDVEFDTASCKFESFKFDDKSIPKLTEFAPKYSVPCKGCAVDDLTKVDGAVVGGRYLFKQGLVTVEEPIKTSAGKEVNWCLKKPDGTCQDYKPLGQQLLSSINDCSGQPLALSLTKGANPSQKILLFPKDGEIVVEIVNFAAEDIFRALPIPKEENRKIDHFAWFYELTSDSTLTDPCPVPETTDFASFAGKPFCPLAEFQPVD